MYKILQIFDEIHSIGLRGKRSEAQDMILAKLRKQPQTAKELADQIGLSPITVRQNLRQLVQQKLAIEKVIDGNRKVYWQP